MPGCRCSAICSTADTMYDMSGILRLAQRRRHADVDRVELGDDVEVGGRVQRAGRRRGARPPRSGTSGMYDVPWLTASTLRCVEIDAGGVEAGAGELDRERQPDVAEADDADARGRLVDRARGGGAGETE